MHRAIHLVGGIPAKEIEKALNSGNLYEPIILAILDPTAKVTTLTLSLDFNPTNVDEEIDMILCWQYGVEVTYDTK